MVNVGEDEVSNSHTRHLTQYLDRITLLRKEPSVVQCMQWPVGFQKCPGVVAGRESQQQPASQSFETCKETPEDGQKQPIMTQTRK